MSVLFADEMRIVYNLSSPLHELLIVVCLGMPLLMAYCVGHRMYYILRYILSREHTLIDFHGRYHKLIFFVMWIACIAWIDREHAKAGL